MQGCNGRRLCRRASCLVLIPILLFFPIHRRAFADPTDFLFQFRTDAGAYTMQARSVGERAMSLRFSGGPQNANVTFALVATALVGWTEIRFTEGPNAGRSIKVFRDGTTEVAESSEPTPTLDTARNDLRDAKPVSCHGFRCKLITLGAIAGGAACTATGPGALPCGVAVSTGAAALCYAMENNC